MKRQSLWAVPVLLTMLLASCNLPSGQTTPTQQADLVYTAAAETVSAVLTAAVTATAPIPTDTPTPQPTATAAPTNTQSAPNTPVVSVSTATTVACNRLQFVSDITIPDGTSFDPGESFTKTWRLKNVGSCTWTTNYKAVFVSGNKMSAPSSVNLPKNVAPGETVDISVDMVAPGDTGEYTGYWTLADDSGANFSTSQYYVVIKVGGGLFAVTGVYFSVEPDEDEAVDCEILEITFSADIRTNGKGAVQYHWIYKGGEQSAVETLNFSEAGTKTVEFSYTDSTSSDTYDSMVRLYIDEPNHQAFGPQAFTINCE
jgi:hypothetical protein